MFLKMLYSVAATPGQPLVFLILYPKMPPICDRPMMIAAPVVNPEMTAWLRKFTMNPKRRKPRMNCERPARKASCTAIMLYWLWSMLPSSSVSTKSESPEYTSSETRATGPTASCLLEPKMAYAKMGTKDA